MGEKNIDDLSPEIVAWVDDCISFQLENCHRRIFDWQGVEGTREIWHRSLQADLLLLYLHDESVLQRYATACPVEGASPAEYGMRFLQFGDFGNLLAGIHFCGVDVRRPFVHISAMDFAFDPGLAEELGNFLQGEFQVFQPERFRIWADGEDAAATKVPGAVVDQWLIAGRLHDLRQREKPLQHTRISLEEDPQLTSFEDYTKCYAEYHEAHPERKDWSQAATRKDLETCVAEGACFRVCIDGEPAGWIAAAKSDKGPLTGWQMVEELLEARHRGQGLGAAMQRTFLDTLPGENLLWGTINSQNLPSLATAQRVGREIVGGYVFLPFA